MRVVIAFTKCEWDIPIDDDALDIVAEDIGITLDDLLLERSVDEWDEKLKMLCRNIDSYDQDYLIEYYKLTVVLEVLVLLGKSDENRAIGSRQWMSGEQAQQSPSPPPKRRRLHLDDVDDY